MLNLLVVNNYTRGDDCHHYVMKPPPLPFKIKIPSKYPRMYYSYPLQATHSTKRWQRESVLVYHIRNHVEGDGFVA